MIRLHHLNNSRSLRVLWLLEELGLPYGIVHYQRDAKTLLAPPALRRIHSLGKSPIVEDGDIIMAESGAILEYLVDRYDVDRAFAPAPSPDYSEASLRYRYWMHYAEGSAMPPLLLTLVFNRILQSPMPFFAKPIAKAICEKVLQGFVSPQLIHHVNHIESELERSQWFAGEQFTAADIQMSFPLEAIVARTSNLQLPRIRAFLDRIHARPAYRRALDRGGTFQVSG